MLYDIESTLCRHCDPFFLFTSLTSSTSRCCTISNQHRVDIVILSSCLHRSHRRHCDVVRYRINIVSTLWTFLLVYIVHIVDIAMLYDIESASCRHCEPFFLSGLEKFHCKPWNWLSWSKHNQVMFLYISIICYLTVYICILLLWQYYVSPSKGRHIVFVSFLLLILIILLQPKFCPGRNFQTLQPI
jgi:hypothetical protein